MPRIALSVQLILIAFLLQTAAATAANAPLEDSTSAGLFAERLLPLLRSQQQSSCAECHLAGVEIKNYIRESESDTFAALRQAGLINVERPEESKILQFIGRRPERTNPLTEKVRTTELQAFRDWIRLAVQNPNLLQSRTDLRIGTELPPEVIRHTRTDRVLAAFVDNIWSEMGRCVNCHHPERNRHQIGQHGLTADDVKSISWIKPHDPAATLKQLLDSGNIDTEHPELSPLLTKPAGLSPHKGGPKFLPGSASYQNFLTFLRDYTAIQNGSYQKSTDLPDPQTEIRLLSEQQLRITNIPARYNGMTLQINLHRIDPVSKSPSSERWATGISRVNAENQLWQNPILVTAPAASPRADRFRKSPLLPAEQYEVRIFIDQQDQLRKNPESQLPDSSLVATAVIHGDWKPGYQPPRILQFPTQTP